MRYYIIAGEPSGDLHGSNLIAELNQFDTNAYIDCWGGDFMQAQKNTHLAKHIKELAFMGFWEVLTHLSTILKNIHFCKNDILQKKPDVLVLIDYPGFNLRIAQWAKQQGFKVVYYISPQVWAWKEGRVKGIKKYVDKMLCIFPFEVDFYKKWKLNVQFVGHPLIQVIEKEMQKPIVPLASKKIIALLPGSRMQEVTKILPEMLRVVPYFNDYQFIIAQSPTLPLAVYTPYTSPFENVSVVPHNTYNLLKQASAALVTSGTATLETALCNVPQIVCYKGNPISFAIAKRVINIKYISIVNLIANKLVVKELIQDKLNTNNLVAELTHLLTDDAYIQKIKNNYQQIKQLLGSQDASKTAAEIIYSFAETP